VQKESERREREREGRTAEDDVAQVVELVAVAELRVLLEELHELDGVVGRLALAIRGEAEDDEAVVRDGIQVVEVVAARESASQRSLS